MMQLKPLSKPVISATNNKPRKPKFGKTPENQKKVVSKAERERQDNKELLIELRSHPYMKVNYLPFLSTGEFTSDPCLYRNPPELSQTSKDFLKREALKEKDPSFKLNEEEKRVLIEKDQRAFTESLFPSIIRFGSSPLCLPSWSPKFYYCCSSTSYLCVICPFPCLFSKFKKEIAIIHSPLIRREYANYGELYGNENKRSDYASNPAFIYDRVMVENPDKGLKFFVPNYKTYGNLTAYSLGTEPIKEFTKRDAQGNFRVIPEKVYVATKDPKSLDLIVPLKETTKEVFCFQWQEELKEEVLEWVRTEKPKPIVGLGDNPYFSRVGEPKKVWITNTSGSGSWFFKGELPKFIWSLTVKVRSQTGKYDYWYLKDQLKECIPNCRQSYADFFESLEEDKSYLELTEKTAKKGYTENIYYCSHCKKNQRCLIGKKDDVTAIYCPDCDTSIIVNDPYDNSFPKLRIKNLKRHWEHELGEQGTGLEADLALKYTPDVVQKINEEANKKRQRKETFGKDRDGVETEEYYFEESIDPNLEDEGLEE